ncbi:MAG: hypothetical protein K9H49_05840 [Bacteroidales bacterium]|nr:hypothetical protein [Bacteroidales bacterium]MCF8404370.1 hypothetical protein [Bacteroidales bacterium]
MKTLFVSVILILLSCCLSAQVLLNNSDTKNSITLKAGWDQTIATGINYSHSLNSALKNHPTSFQIEFLSPLATFHQFNNGRLSTGIQTGLFRKNHFGIIANAFVTYSWSNDVLAIIKGVGIYTSIIPAIHTNNNWILAFEFVYRPTLFSHFRFSEIADDTFNDRYSATSVKNEVPDRNGWYIFTNNKYQVAFLMNKKINKHYQLGLKLGLEHFRNEHKVLLNGWIGQIPINANINFTYNF